jgi:hypothetical protein
MRMSDGTFSVSSCAIVKAVAKSRAAASISGVIVPFRRIIPTVSTVRWTVASRPLSGSKIRIGSVGGVARTGPANVTARFRLFRALFAAIAALRS